jgi:hypothetical protein
VNRHAGCISYILFAGTNWQIAMVYTLRLYIECNGNDLTYVECVYMRTFLRLYPFHGFVTVEYGEAGSQRTGKCAPRILIVRGGGEGGLLTMRLLLFVFLFKNYVQNYVVSTAVT